MATTAEMPVNVALNAADRVLELGVWTDFKVMLEHTRQTVPGVRSISVWLDDQSGRSDPTIIITADRDESEPGPPGESPEWRWDRWASETFSPDVLRHFCMMAIPCEGESAATDDR